MCIYHFVHQSPRRPHHDLRGFLLYLVTACRDGGAARLRRHAGDAARSGRQQAAQFSRHESGWCERHGDGDDQGDLSRRRWALLSAYLWNQSKTGRYYQTYLAIASTRRSKLVSQRLTPSYILLPSFTEMHVCYKVCIHVVWSDGHRCTCPTLYVFTGAANKSLSPDPPSLSPGLCYIHYMTVIID